MNIYKQLYKITSKDDLRSVLMGIHHKDGNLIALNGHVLAIVKSNYDEKLEDAIMDRNGVAIEGKFPNVSKLSYATKSSKGQLNSKLFRAAEKLRGVKDACIHINGEYYLKVAYILLIKDLMFGLGEFPDFIAYNDITQSITFQSATVKALITPLYPEEHTKYKLFDYDAAESFVKEKKSNCWYEK